MATILTYDEQGFIVSSGAIERKLKSINDDTRDIIQILTAQNQVNNTRITQIARNAERIAQNLTTGRLSRSARIHSRSDQARSSASPNISPVSSLSRSQTDTPLRGVRRRAEPHQPPSARSDVAPGSRSRRAGIDRDGSGRFTSGNRAESDGLLRALRDNAGVHGAGVNTSGVDPLVDSANEVKDLLSPLTRGAGMAGRAAKWSWSKFRSLKKREPLPRDQERHNRENESLLEKILKQLQRGGGSGDGGLLSGLLGRGGRGLMGGGLLGGLLGGLFKGGGKALKFLGKAKFLGPLAAMFGVGNLAMDWDSLDHEGKSEGVGGLLGGGAGAIAGGILGSFLGPVGTVVGASIGGWLGNEAGEWLGKTASPYIQGWTQSLKDYNLPDKMKSVWENGIRPFFSKLGELGAAMKSWIDQKLDAAKSFLGIGGDADTLPNQVAVNASEYALKHAAAQSLGRCAEFVNNAFQANGLKAGGHGKDVANNLMEWNDGKFDKVEYSENYVPQIGDVMSMPSSKNSKHSYGHAAIYTKDGWVSDFKQGEKYGNTAAPNADYYDDIKSGRIKPTIARMKGPQNPSAAPLPTDSRGRRDQAMAYFISKGYTKEQAAGLVANLQQESQFNHGAVGDGGKAYGLAQWHPDRQANFKKAFGKDIRSASFEDQLAFVDYELTKGTEKGAGQKLKSAKSAREAAAIVSKYYERPADEAGEMAKRAKLAESILTNTTISKSNTAKAKPTSSTLGFSLGDMKAANNFASASKNITSALPAMPISKLFQVPAMPKISQRLDSGGQKPIVIQANNDSIGQNVSDRGLAHAITGGLGQDRYWG